MIALETGWFEIVQYNDKDATTVANLFDQAWLCRYPRPMIILYDRRNEFLGHAFKNDLIENKYGTKPKFATTKTHKLIQY